VTRSRNLVQRVMEAGEAQVDRVVGQLLSNEKFVSAVQSVVATTLAAKGTLDKSLRGALATMNLPSTADVAELGRRLDRLERVLAELDEKLGRLEAASGAPAEPAGEAPAKKKPAARKPAPKRTTGKRE